MKNEDLLQYIWKFQKYDSSNLQTNQGQSLTIVKPGQHNTDSGPDFENARIIIDGIEWAGQIEIHINSADWFKHNHQSDKAYDNVILHVLWEDSTPIFRDDKSQIPSLSLKDRIPKILLEKYLFLKNNQNDLACQNQFEIQNDLIKTTMLERALAHRLERKAEELFELYEKNNHDLEEVAYQTLMKNFGFKLNSETFLRLAQSIPYKIFHHLNPFQIEALLFGQAGFLDQTPDDYSQKLEKEYQFLSHKYQLHSGKIERSNWKFLRTRPQNFPTVRLAQILQIIIQHPSIFSTIISEKPEKLFEIQVNNYWQNHYDFSKETSKSNTLGADSKSVLMINTFAPILALYSKLADDYEYFEKAILLLNRLKAEKNFITRIWENVNLKATSAFDSQAMIEQFTTFCSNKKCLSCPIGIHILKT